MTAETHRHAGNADIIRELIDGDVGLDQTTTTWRQETGPGGEVPGSA